MKGRPISLGFNVFYQNYQFIGQGFGATTSQDIFGNLTGSSLFTQKTAGASVSASAPLQYFAKRFRMGRFIRLGLSYSFHTTDIVDPAVNRDDDPTNDILVTFRQSGVTQSTLCPSISYNTLNSSLDPTRGKSVTLGLAFTGGPLGGKVNTIAPTFEFKYFRPLFAGREARARIEAGRPTRTFGCPCPVWAHQLVWNAVRIELFLVRRGHAVVLALLPWRRAGHTRLQHSRYLAERSGSDDFQYTKRPCDRHSDRGESQGKKTRTVKWEQHRAQRYRLSLLSEGRRSTRSVIPFPAFIGGDTQALFNVEYRIPIIGPLQFAPFFDIGSAFNLRSSTINSSFRVHTEPDSGPGNPEPAQAKEATQREISKATPPESQGGLPPGFRLVFIFRR